MLPSTTPFITIFFLFFFSHTPLLFCSQPISSHNRRILHQPLFPIPTTPAPSSPPFQPTPSPSSSTASPPASSSLPKYPSSTNPIPFFPAFPSPPPPPTTTSPDTPTSPTGSTTQPTFPANISSLIFPTTSPHTASPAPNTSHSKLVPAIVAPIICISVVALAAFAFLHHRRRTRRSRAEAARSDVHRLFPSNSTTSDGRKVSASSAAHSADFLYLGTVVNSRGPGVADPAAAAAAAGAGGGSGAPIGAGSPYRKLGSPELHPLPPLSHQSKHTFVNAEAGCSSDDEFYSPRGSNAEKDAAGLLGRQGSGSHRGFQAPTPPPPPQQQQQQQAPVMDKCGSRSSNLSTPSYRSSDSGSSPTPSSPSPASPEASSSSTGKSSAKSLGTRSETVIIDGVELYPPPPPPFRTLSPLTPSPPKRRPRSPSPPPSPPEKRDLDGTAGFADVSSKTIQDHRPPMGVGDYTKNPFVAAPPAPPPPPPPPPPARFWENRTQHSQTLPSNPPALVPPKPVGVKTTAAAAAVYPADSPRTSDDAIDRSNDGTPRPKLKPLHWDKVRASSDRVMVWDQLKCSSFQLNEEMIETLFVCNSSTSTTPKLTGARQVLPSPSQENRVLDPKKSQNIAILLRALNVTKEEVCEALLEGNTDSLGTELLETLLKMAPSKEEEIKLKDYKDDSPFKLGTAEKFLKAVLDIPFAFKRVEAMLYIANFDSEVNYLTKSFDTLEAACEELRSNRMFLKLLEAVLKTGNRMNVGTNRGDAHAFKLDTLLKLVDVKGTDGKTTLLHFVVQEIVRAEGSRLSSGNQNQSNGKTQPNTLRDEHELKKLGLQVVSGLSGELSNVKKAATMDAEVLGNYVSKLAGGIRKISEVLRLNGVHRPQENGQKFQEAMNGFLNKAEDDIVKVQAQESVALSLVKEITEYFHGNSAREEAHPFRIFLVVKDFLSILDQVCKEVGKINERTFISSARNLPVPVNPTSAPVFPTLHNQRASESSDEDDDSSSSS